MLTGPVEFTWSQSIAAGAVFNPLEDWEYETPDREGAVEVFERATAVGLVSAVKSGGDTIKQESPVKAGGTAGVTPSRFDMEPVTGRATRSQKMRIAYRNPTGGAITVDGKIVFTPTGSAGGAVRRTFRRARRGRR